MERPGRLVFAALLAASILLTLAGCAAPAQEVTEKQVTAVVTQVVEKEVVVTATPAGGASLPEGEVAGTTPVKGGTIRVSFASDIPNIGDPPPSWDSASWMSHHLLYAGLLRWKGLGPDTEPDLAEALPAVSPDGMKYTFKLRDGLKFANGRPLTAEDVKYSLDRMLLKDTGGWGTSYYTAIKGAKEALAGAATTVEGIRVLDPRTIEIELAEPLAPSWFMALMATPWTYVVDREAVEKYGQDFAYNPSGAGPYVLKEYVPAQKAVFERNPNYWRAPDEPYADRIEVQLSVDTPLAALKLEKGELDMIGDPWSPVSLKPFLDNPAWAPYIKSIADTGSYFIAFDTSQGLTKDLKVRQAIAHAIDKERLIQVMGAQAKVANSHLSPSAGAYYDPTISGYEYDPDKARALLKEAGVAEGTKLEFWSANYYPWKDLAQAVQQDLEAVGFATDLHLVGRAAWYEANANHNPLVFNQWPLELPDPSYIFDGGFSKAAFYPDSCCNWSWYSTDDLEAKLAAARGEQDPAKRAKMYQELDRFVTQDELLWLPLFYLDHLQVHAPRLGGFGIPAVYGGPAVTFVGRFWAADGK